MFIFFDSFKTFFGNFGPDELSKIISSITYDIF